MVKYYLDVAKTIISLLTPLAKRTKHKLLNEI